MSIEPAPERDAPAPRTLIGRRELLRMHPETYPTIWKKMRAGKFPLPVKLGDSPNSPNAWFLDEVVEHQENLKRAEFKPLTEAEIAASSKGNENDDDPEAEAERIAEPA